MEYYSQGEIEFSARKTYSDLPFSDEQDAELLQFCATVLMILEQIFASEHPLTNHIDVERRFLEHRVFSEDKLDRICKQEKQRYLSFVNDNYLLHITYTLIDTFRETVVLCAKYRLLR